MSNRNPHTAMVKDALTGRYTLEALGKRYDLTRERVRQVLAQQRLTNDFKEARQEVARLHKVDKDVAAFRKRAKVARECCVCGYWVLRKTANSNGARRVTCSHECAEAWRLLRFVIDPEEHRIHRLAVARNTLQRASRGKATASQVRWAVRAMSGKLPSPPQYVRTGSQRDAMMKELGREFTREEEYFKDGLPWGPTRGGPDGLMTHCQRGHPFDEENTYVSQNGTRYCRACQRRRSREYYERKKGQDVVSMSGVRE